MSGLRRRMAENGFESNQDYSYILNILTHNHDDAMVCINVQGQPGRHKTAFTQALVHSIDNIVHVVYHDFSATETPSTPVYLQTNEDSKEAKVLPPVSALDRAVSDACAYSEAESTVLILDQLHLADFKDHIRLYQFLISQEWHYQQTTFYANKPNLVVFMISEEPVYHSLQKHSFRVWVNARSDASMVYQPSDFGLGNEFEPVMTQLAKLFEQLELTPTFSEYRKILNDIQRCVSTSHDLVHIIFGWMEGVEYEMLKAEAIEKLLQTEIMPAIEKLIGVDQLIELSALEINR